jgi:hypothetical protein
MMRAPNLECDDKPKFAPLSTISEEIQPIQLIMDSPSKPKHIATLGWSADKFGSPPHRDLTP